MTEFAFVRAADATAFLFPGQGSQRVGMAKALADAYPVARETLEEADHALGFALSDLCFNGPKDELTDTINAQPALLAASVAALRVIDDQLGGADFAGGDGPRFVVGHSMGEYSALVAAGSLAYADALRLVRERGRLMKEAGHVAPGMMAAILGLDEETVAEICMEATLDGGVAQVANDNCPGQVVISGDRMGMERAMSALSVGGARKVMPLAVSIAAHSPLMAPAAAALNEAIAATPIAPPHTPVIGNTSARPLTTVDEIRAELAAQLTGSVRWADSMRYALDQGVTDFVEIGPGQVLTGLMKRIQRKARRRAVDDPESVRAFVADFQAAYVNH
jgi:[acyl-carrier-protein] S-malonyltransferase